MKIQVLAMILIALLLTSGASAQAGVRMKKINDANHVAFVEDSTWEPEGFDRGTIVHTAKVVEGPRIDGVADDPAWNRAKSVTIPLAYGAVKEATLKAVYTDEEIFLLVSWPDPTRDDQHHPWVWDDTQGRYIEGPQVEDALLVSVERGCGWTPSLLSGYVYDFDGWRWLAARTNPIGQAVDADGGTSNRSFPGFVEYPNRNTTPFWNLFLAPRRRINILTTPWQDLRREYHFKPIVTTVYVRMEPDGLQPPAFVERLRAPEPKDSSRVGPKSAHAAPVPPAVVPQYKPVKLEGDAGEIAAKGRWADGRWTVEFRRVLVTPAKHITDSYFYRVTQFSIHVFDRTERVDESSESGRLFFQFEPAKERTQETMR
jgi:hypothetical protein